MLVGELETMREEGSVEENQNSDTPLTGECEMYQVNPVNGWVARHVYTGELTVRFVRLKSVSGNFFGWLAKMALCPSCARQLDTWYETAQVRERSDGHG